MPRRPLYRVCAVGLLLLAMVFAGQASYQISTSNGRPVVDVTAGDTLWAIAQQYGVSVNALAAANGMQLTDILEIGRHLVIPTDATLTAMSTSTSSSSTSTSSTSQTSASADPNFCQTFTPQPGPYGQLPWLLTVEPAREALQPLFVEWANAYGISPALLEAIAWQESGWQQGAVSSAGAIGIGQVMPGTARFIENDLLHEQLNVNSPSDNIQLSARYLAFLSAELGGNLCETIAAYNEGTINLNAYGVFPVTQQYVADVEGLLPRFE